MQESAQASQLEGYYVWESPTKSLTILLSLQTVGRLQKFFHEASRPNEEIGGFLLGRLEHDGPGRFITTIDDFEAVESDWQRSPHYELNERDRKRFARRLSRSRSERDPTLAPVGYFRTHLRPDLFLTATDLALMQNFFPGPSDVALVVRPEPDLLSGFFFREDGAIRVEPYFTFALDKKRLQQDNSTILKSPEAKPGAWLRPRRTKSAWALRWLWAAAGVLLVALGILGNYGIRSGLRATTATVPPSLPTTQVAKTAPELSAKAAPETVVQSGSADRSIESASPAETKSPPRKSRVKTRGKHGKRSTQRKSRDQ